MRKIIFEGFTLQHEGWSPQGSFWACETLDASCIHRVGLEHRYGSRGGRTRYKVTVYATPEVYGTVEHLPTKYSVHGVCYTVDDSYHVSGGIVSHVPH